MNNLEEIDGIGEKAVELFKSININDIDSLSSQKTAELYSRLFEANRDRNIYSHLPPIHTVEEWVAAARILRADDLG